MNFTLDQIENEEFYLFEKESKSRKSSAYNVYMRCAFRTWNELPEVEKMKLMRPALSQTIILRLENSGLLSGTFNKDQDDPYLLAPFNSNDLRADLRSVVSYYWKLMEDEKRLAWTKRKNRLNARPTLGTFSGDLPQTLLTNTEDQYHDHTVLLEKIIRRVLKKDFMGVQHQIEKSFKRYENCKTIYNKREYVYLYITVSNKFYFYQQVPCIVLDALFGKQFSKFKNEFVSTDRGGDVKVFHVRSQQRMRDILSVSDLDLSLYISYKDVEVEHRLCSYAMIKRVDSSVRGDQGFKCYGWTEDENNVITFILNNYDNTSRLEVGFTSPTLEKLPTTNIDKNGNKTTTLKWTYAFDQRTSISKCGMFVMTYFCPAIFEINVKNSTLKLIALRCSINADNNDVVNKNLSS